MTRENKIQLRTALDEPIRERYNEIEDNLSELTICLFDVGLMADEVGEIVPKVRESQIKRMIHFYS